MIVAGVGCRRGASAAEVRAAIAAALHRAGLAGYALDLVATAASKGGEPGISAAARSLGVPLVLVPQRDLEAQAPRTATRSERVVALMGVPSVAEAAALAVGGPASRLVAAKTSVGPATCALATTVGAP
ncbi:MAG TPA: cobalamin biosynthesis protein [Xanthobacteraceae bacterium]|nr:cobalamin biosynthesis protein [Xanthobacteraceae bacterium]